MRFVGSKSNGAEENDRSLFSFRSAPGLASVASLSQSLSLSTSPYLLPSPSLYKGFYRYNPKSAVWASDIICPRIRDLINWIALDSAITPSKSFAIYGCWSGSATIFDGSPVIVYTGIIDTDPNTIPWIQVQNIAYSKNLSDPYLREWVKPDYNPILPIGPGINGTEFRNPTTAWYNPLDKQWRPGVGSMWDYEGKVLLYKSKDFKTWVKATDPLYSVKEERMWECPDFYPVSVKGYLGLDTSVYGQDTKHVLKVIDGRDRYTIGTYDTKRDRYTPDATFANNKYGLLYDYGNFYASKTFYDPVKKRRILWGWSNESDTVEEDNIKGWAGIQDSLARSKWEELNSLRGSHISVTSTTVKQGGLQQVIGIQTAQADVEVTFEVSSLDKAEPFDTKYANDAQAFCKIKGPDVKGGVGPFGLHVLATTDLQERTSVFF
ncbi:hypothetical protein LUZ62_026203 [Rhynchospora pubera]|uniref:Beta-fructofuranosidase n=1 Tax=Rhynchospora pubera TaxID=906938 RepID=A0AAV8H7U3_9POAL|nr:hypothetical protein LUZ62_026203 [Rhynchospora pubera]